MVRRVIAIITVLVVIMNFVWVSPVAAAKDYSTIRVKLSSMGSPKSIRLIIEGNYTIKELPKANLKQSEYRVDIVNALL